MDANAIEAVVAALEKRFPEATVTSTKSAVVVEPLMDFVGFFVRMPGLMRAGVAYEGSLPGSDEIVSMFVEAFESGVVPPAPPPNEYMVRVYKLCSALRR